MFTLNFKYGAALKNINFAPIDKILDENSASKFHESECTKFCEILVTIFWRNFAKVNEQNFDEIKLMFALILYFAK
jgi:hypothetical protein